MERIDELKPFYDSLLSRFTNEEWNCYCTFFIQKGKEFDFSKNRVLFIGKSVNGWISSSKSVDELFSQSNPDRIVNRDDEIEWVQNCAGCAKGYNSRRSAFWRIIIGVINRIEKKKEWYKYVSWSNLYKISPDIGNPNSKMKRKQQEICCSILDKEIEILNPRAIVFLTTSGWENFYVQHIGLDLQKNKKIKWGRYVTSFQEVNGIKYVFSQHPQGKREDCHIDAICSIIEDTSIC